jgi:ATP adenylyltransferase
MTGSTPAQRDASCFLCLAAGIEDSMLFSGENLVIHRAQHTFVILNRFPYSSGHLLVSPVRHVGSLEELDPAESLDLMSQLQNSTKALKLALRPDGFNVGINLGHTAGAGVPGHLHVHVVPRWSGDHNFMPVTGQTRVMPMLLEDSWKTIQKAFAEVLATKGLD